MPYSEETTDDLIINLMLNTPYNPETAEPNQVYLTPDTTDQDIADAISEHNTSNTAHTDIRNAIPTKISDLTDDTATYPIDKADTLTGLTSSITELNYVDGVTSNIQTQLNNKLAKKPDGTNDLVDSNNKVNITYLPDVVLGQMLYAGPFVPSTAVATLSTNAKTILGTTSNTITLTNDTSAITGYEANEGNYYIASSDGTFASISFLTGDWLISTGSGWTKVSNTDAVTGVKGNAESTYRTGNVNLTPSDIGAYPDTNPNGYTSNVGTVTSVNSTSPDANGNVSLTIPSINSSNNYVPYRSSASAFSNSTLMYNSSAMAFTGKAHVGSSSPSSYSDKGRFTIYDNTASQQVTSMALLNYGGGGGCGVAIDMYNTSANGGIPSGRFGLVDNGNYSGYLQLQVKKSGAASNPLLPAMNIVPVPATSSLTTCISFGQDEFNRVLFDLHKPEATVTITDTDKRWGGSGTTYSVTGSNKFNPRLLVAVGDIVSFDSFATEATVTAVVSNSTTCQITTNTTLGTVSNKNISVKKAYFKITDENNNTKVFVDPYGKMGIGTLTPNYTLDVAGTINASSDIKVNGTSVLTSISSSDVTDALGYTPYNATNPNNYSAVTFYWGE